MFDPGVEIDIKGFAGAARVQHKTVSCYGGETGARDVVERSLAFARQYADVLARNGYSAAYDLLDSGLRSEMSLEEFASEQESAEEIYGGPVASFSVEQFAFVLTDNAARAKVSARKGGWPKATPKDNYRSRVLGFWIRNVEENTGCYGSLWITEESGEYRCAGFNYNRG